MTPVPEPGRSASALPAELVERFRPVVASHSMSALVTAPPGKVLVLGAYLADVPTNVADVVSRLDESAHDVIQRWVAVGGRPTSDLLGEVTVRVFDTGMPKLHCLDEALAGVDVQEFDHVLLVDDDVVLPHSFLDLFLSLQSQLGFAIAQPARTPGSFTDLPIVQQQRGVLARRTRFVEVGPLVSFSRSAYEILLPFDVTSPMGWGLETVWAHRAEVSGLMLGIVDAVPIDHSLRKPAGLYSWAEADRGRRALWSSTEHLPQADCFRVLEVTPLPGGDDSLAEATAEPGSAPPRISVVIPTRDRAGLLSAALESLAQQDLPEDAFEVIVVDDGSVDATPVVCAKHADPLRLRYQRIGPSGTSSAKNLGLFMSRGEIVLFFDDDDVAAPD
ncbi:MAG: glycosyltransferase family A protein, partial [Acidimicrobiales bacterium]